MLPVALLRKSFPRVLPLGEFLRGALGRSIDGGGLSDLLETIYVAAAEEEIFFSFDSLEDHNTVLLRVVEAKLGGRDALTYGMHRTASGGVAVKRGKVYDFLTGHAWNLIHSRIGTPCFEYLLRDTSVFAPFTPQRDRLVQLCGPPITRPGKLPPVVNRFRIFYRSSPSGRPPNEAGWERALERHCPLPNPIPTDYPGLIAAETDPRWIVNALFEWLPRSMRDRRSIVSFVLKLRRFEGFEAADEVVGHVMNSYVIPAICRDFYVTDADGSRKVVYYRRPIWERAVEASKRLMSSSFVRDPGAQPNGRLRLIPKSGKPRLIANLSVDASFHLAALTQAAVPEALGVSLFTTRLLSGVPKGECVIKLDISGCFDNILLPKLMRIIEPLIRRESSYTVSYYAGSDEKRTRYTQTNTEGYFPHGSVVVDYATSRTVSAAQVVEDIRRMLCENRVTFGGETFRQIRGIPQGLALSPLLCALYFGDLERRFFPGFREAGCFIQRFTDDYIFVGPRAGGEEFLEFFNSPIVRDEYGVRLNRDKAVVSWEAEASEWFPSPNPCIAWCGLLVDTVTGEWYMDYVRKMDKPVQDDLTVTAGGFGRKMEMYLNARNIPLLWEQSETTVLLNLYQLFLWLAIKFHRYVRCLGQYDTDLLYGIVVENVFQHASRVLPEHPATRSLAIHAFLVVLQRKQTRFKELVRRLERLPQEEYPETTGAAGNRLFEKKLI